MAEVPAPSGNLLTRKWGPVQVWVWGVGGLVVAWLIAKWQANKSGNASKTDATEADTADTAQSEQVAPQFIIENNMPATPVGVGAPPTPSTPVPPTTTPPVVTPPSTTPNPPATTPPKPPAKPPAKPAKPKAPLTYTVKHGDTLSAIAKKYGTTWQALWTYNTTAGNRPADTIKTLKARGPNLLYAGEKILVPQK